jgi:hypothetical protein
MATEFARKLEDDELKAILFGLVGVALPLVVFLGGEPNLRTARGIVWIGGSSVLFGIIGYCHRRAATYIRDDVPAWRMLSGWGLLHTNRYEEPGRPFVRAQIVCAIILAIWWLGGGIFLIG